MKNTLTKYMRAQYKSSRIKIIQYSGQEDMIIIDYYCNDEVRMIVVLLSSVVEFAKANNL